MNLTNEEIRGLKEIIRRFRVTNGLNKLVSTDNSITFTSNGCHITDLSATGGGGIQSIQEGDNITVDNTDPLNPIVSASGGGTIDTISITYADFYNAITNSQLIGGMTYVITDFQTIYDQMDFNAGGSLKPTLVTKTGATEQIWVLALAPNQIASQAYSATYPNDQIQYDWTYNTTFVNGSPAKGRISERIDENNNRTDYDHREIKFIRYDNGAGNFTVINDNGNASQEFLTFVQNFTGGTIKDNWLGDFYSISALYGQEYGNNVFSGNVVISNTSSALFYNNTFSGSVTSNTFSGNVNRNTFSGNVYSNTFSGEVYNNTFSGGNVYRNTFSGYVYNNTFSSYVYNNTFSGYVSGNTFSGYVYNNTFSGEVNSNTFSNDVHNNTFSGSVNSNTFSGGDVTSNTFNGTVTSNTFSGNVFSNTFNGSVTSNTFSGNVSITTFSGHVIANTFSGYVYENTFSGEVYQNTFGGYVYSNTFSSNVTNNTFSGYVYSNTFNGHFIVNTFSGNVYINTFSGYVTTIHLHTQGN
jgi:hypothetical protein